MKTHRLSIILRDLANKIDAFEAANDIQDDTRANERMDLVWDEIRTEGPQAVSAIIAYLDGKEI